jgi:hypothetical protein
VRGVAEMVREFAIAISIEVGLVLSYLVSDE